MTISNLHPEAVFICDVHLGGFDYETNIRLESDFVELIHHCMTHSIKIYLLGDVFDYWMEYSKKTPDVGQNARHILKKYNERFGPTVYITGNHDNWTIDYFQNIGFVVEHEYIIEEFNNTKVLLMHGDGLADPSMGFSRPWFHRLLRNAYFIRLFRALIPPTSGIWLTKMFSRFSKLTDADNNRVTESLDNWAHYYLKNNSPDVIICGHHHTPLIEHLEKKVYINTGAFYLDKTLGAYTNGRFGLVLWDGEKRYLRTIDK